MQSKSVKQVTNGFSNMAFDHCNVKSGK